MTLDEAREAAPEVAADTVTYEITPAGQAARHRSIAEAVSEQAGWGWPGARNARIARAVGVALGVMRYSPGRWSVSVGSPDGHRVDVFRSTLADALLAAADVADGIEPSDPKE